MSQMTSICRSCHAGCCRAFAVPITGADVLRLERATGQSFWDFACRWEDHDGIISGEYAPQLYFDDEPLTPFALCLLHQPSVIAPTTTKCRFLAETPSDEPTSLGTAQCQVYHARPAACRVFPLKMQTASPLTILSDVPAQGRPEDGHPMYALCPRDWQPDDIDPVDGPQDVAVAEYEGKFFKQVAELWNEQLGSWLQFPEFLHQIYERRVVRPEPSAAEPHADGPITLPFPTTPHPLRRVA